MLRRVLRLSALLLLVPMVSSSGAFSQQTSSEEAPVPAYNSGPPPKGAKLPDILGPEQLWGANSQNAFQTHAYELARKIPAVLHQQPCYCYCDRMGHKSLRSCFEGTHGAQCATCLKELYYAYSMNRKGKTAVQIRQGIVRAEWKQIDLQTASAIN